MFKKRKKETLKATNNGVIVGSQVPKGRKQKIASSVKKHKRPIIGIFALVTVVALALAGYSYYVKRNTVAIDNSEITKQTIDDYEAELQAYKQKNPQAELPSDLRQMAIDDLVMNAALKKEATKNNVEVSDANLALALTDDNTLTEAQIKEKVDGLRTGSRMTYVRQENKAYKQRLEDSLISKKNLFMMSIAYDSPYQSSLPDDKVQASYDEAKKRLNDEFLPLFKEKLPADQIAAKAQVNMTDTNEADDANPEPYNTGLVSLARVEKDYVRGVTEYNDIDYKDNKFIRGNLGEMFSNDDKIATLKNDGDYTDVFAAKNGFYSIIRLESKSKGEYENWDAFLAKYKKDYVAKLSMVTGYNVNIASTVTQAAQKAAAAADSLANPKAEAAVNSSSCASSGHQVEYVVRAYDQQNDVQMGSTGGGAKIKITGSSGRRCIGPSGYTITSGSGSTNTVFDDCNQAAPSFQITGGEPTGYNKVSGSTDGHKVRNGKSDSANSSSLKQGYPSDNWRAMDINGAHLYIYVYYVPEPPDRNPSTPTITGEANCVNGNTIRIRANRDPNAVFSYSIVWTTSPYPGAPNASGNTDGNGVVERTFNGPSSGITNSWAGYVNISGGGVTKTYSFSGGRCKAPEDNRQGCQEVVQENCYKPRVDMNCLGARISGVQPGLRIKYKSFYAYNTSGGFTEYANDVATAGPDGSVFLPINNNGTYRELYNQGWAMWIGSEAIEPYVYSANTYGSCWQAECTNLTLTGQPAGWPENHAKAGQTLSGTATIRNPGTPVKQQVYGHAQSFGGQWPLLGEAYTDPNYFGTPGLRDGVASASISVNGAFGGLSYPVPYPPGPGESVDVPIAVNVPDSTDPANVTIQAYADYTHKQALGSSPACVKTVNAYKEFKYTPSTSLGMTDMENPKSVDYTYSAVRDYPKNTAIDNTVTGKLLARGAEVRSSSVSGTPIQLNGNGNWVDTPVWNLGDELCARVSLKYETGFVGANGELRDTDPGVPRDDCRQVHNKPFVKVFGADVMAGGAFNQSGNAYIAGYTKGQTAGNGVPAGAGTEFAAYSTGGQPIREFSSAMLRRNLPISPTGLAFTSPNGTGFTRADSIDWFMTTKKDALAPTPGTIFDTAAAADKEQTLMSGNVTVAPKSGYNKRHTLYVDGNVFIQGSGVQYAAGPLTPRESIPSFVVVATGNIYIDKSVTQLDGIYVAQPKSTVPDSGTIYTCSTNFSPEINSNPAVCGNKLLVNGSLLSKTTKYLRTFGTLREVPIESTSPETYRREAFNNTRAAETIRLTPEIYLAQPILKPRSSESAGPYDSLVSLPPVL